METSSEVMTDAAPACVDSSSKIKPMLVHDVIRPQTKGNIKQTLTDALDASYDVATEKEPKCSDASSKIKTKSKHNLIYCQPKSKTKETPPQIGKKTPNKNHQSMLINFDRHMLLGILKENIPPAKKCRDQERMINENKHHKEHVIEHE